ncbi:pyruvate, water dikinase regulatory protein [Natranaerofaba carboxydovora]|uniref:pyruvate, water dikinase regulatory protein n=1 Tax=Natranaerofaba carboxydovora TaxID=2742683 RepID=UPI001F13A489|nr:pyruvate, water dikinase regulatory protein [Natranaerofaba carboxydovora]UMZ73095.1 Putative pyruvate, phosphate dikinase regulatory protein [Natranaerofaba carboxydovora]
MTDIIEENVCYIVSDSIGETAELVVKAVASQFNSDRIELRRIPFVNDTETIKEIVEEAEGFNSIIAYTLVTSELRDIIEREAKGKNITTVDIMGPMMDTFREVFKKNPRQEAGLVRKLDESYFRRVDAIEFAVKYDDGKDPRGILKADVVLIGVSRTSKTPLSMYLANKRLKVANMPLVPEVEPPEELFKIPKRRIIGLTISPDKLNEIRKERLKTLGLKAKANYASMERILEELEFSENFMKKLGCPRIDVSNRAVEETAQSILKMIRESERDE